MVINIKEKEYNARLTAKACIELEKKLGQNPLNFFINVNENNLPPLTAMIAIVGCAIKVMNHGITDDDVYDMYDDYISDGHSMSDFINLIIELFRDAGFIPKDEEIDSKN